MASPATLLLVPLEAELKPLARRLGLRNSGGPRYPMMRSGRVNGRRVVAVGVGVGPAAGRAAESWIEVFRPGLVLIVGTAGAANPALESGEVCVPHEVIDGATGQRLTPTGPGPERGILWSSPSVVADPLEKSRLWREQGVDLIDMESAAIGRLCDVRSVLWLCVRAVLDTSDASLPPGLASLVGDHGEIRLFAAARYALGRPSRLPALVRLGRDTGRAMHAAAERLLTLV